VTLLAVTWLQSWLVGSNMAAKGAIVGNLLKKVTDFSKMDAKMALLP
jgi:hypothetical protein